MNLTTHRNKSLIEIALSESPNVFYSVIDLIGRGETTKAERLLIDSIINRW
jgi:hypothetical protein